MRSPTRKLHGSCEKLCYRPAFFGGGSKADHLRPLLFSRFPRCADVLLCFLLSLLLLQVTHSLLDMGCYSVSLGDTIGVGTAGSTLAMLQSLTLAGVPMDKLAAHFHDTYGQALANILVALEEVGAWCYSCDCTSYFLHGGHSSHSHSS